MKVQLTIGAALIAALAGTGQAFSPFSSRPPSVSLRHGPSLEKSSRRTALHSTAAGNDNNDIRDRYGDYDYDALMSSDVERTRLDRQYARFGYKDWLRHRASDRFYASLFKFGRSATVKNLLDEAAVLAAICAFIIAWNELLIDGYDDFSLVHHDPILSGALPSWLTFKLALPTDPFFLCGGPLGLLLVFRNDASFGRYREAFHHWETAVSSLSNMMLMAANASGNVKGVKDMGKAAWALCRTLRHEVSGGFDSEEQYGADVRGIYAGNDAREGEGGGDDERAERLLSARNKLYRAQYDVHRSVGAFSDELTNLDMRTLINTLNTVSTACVECERLYKTPIPLTYTRHALKFLTLWMTFMPFAFYDVFARSWNHVLMIPAICVICFLFFGIEEIAVSLEEPFSILPLDELVEDFGRNVEDTTRWMEEDQRGEKE